MDKATFEADLKTAMKARDALRTSTLRMVKTELVKHETDHPDQPLDEERILALLRKMKKSREESATAFRDAGRTELAEKEEAELAIIEAYLPAPLDDAALDALVDEAIAESGATSMKEIGKVMPVAMARAAGRADGKTINQRVRQRLGG